MAGEVSQGSVTLVKGVTMPVAVAVGIVVAIAWVITWATSDLTMGLMGMGGAMESGTLGVAAFFAIMVVMMVAMMLPAAVPMIVAFHGITRLEVGRPTKPADIPATALFVSTYLLVWAVFGVLALFGLGAIGLLGPFEGLLALVPAGTLLAAGVYQVTRPKEVCLEHCQSPMNFVLLHWRSGRVGALRMGLRHSMYCLGCCWLFMLVLFIAGSMSLVWMGGLSAAIFSEKVGTKSLLATRGIGAVLLVFGTVLVLRTIIPF